MKKPCLLMIIMSIMLSSCLTFSNLTTPEVLEPGEVQVGAGASLMINAPDEIFPIYEIGGRLGVAEKFDVGLKYTVFQVLTTDVKYQFLDGKLDAAVDLETSFFCSEGNYIIGIYPAILIGQKHWYTGIKATFGTLAYGFDYAYTTAIAGVRIGIKKFNILLEGNAIISTEDNDFEIGFYPSIGFNYKFNLKKSK